MIAIRSRVQALACTDRSHWSSVLASRISAIGDVHGSSTGTRLLTRSNRHWIRDTSSNSMIDSLGMVLRYDRTLPRQRIRFLPWLWVGTVSQPSSAASATTASWVGPDEGPAQVDRYAGDGRGRRPAADTVAAFEDHHVMPESDQLTRCREPREPGAHDDDVAHLRWRWSRV